MQHRSDSLKASQCGRYLAPMSTKVSLGTARNLTYGPYLPYLGQSCVLPGLETWDWYFAHFLSCMRGEASCENHKTQFQRAAYKRPTSWLCISSASCFQCSILFPLQSCCFNTSFLSRLQPSLFVTPRQLFRQLGLLRFR